MNTTKIASEITPRIDDHRAHHVVGVVDVAHRAQGRVVVEGVHLREPVRACARERQRAHDRRPEQPRQRGREPGERPVPLHGEGRRTGALRHAASPPPYPGSAGRRWLAREGRSGSVEGVGTRHRRRPRSTASNARRPSSGTRRGRADRDTSRRPGGNGAVMTTPRTSAGAIGRPSVSPTMYDRSHTAIIALAVAAWRATSLVLLGDRAHGRQRGGLHGFEERGGDVEQLLVRLLLEALDVELAVPDHAAARDAGFLDRRDLRRERLRTHRRRPSTSRRRDRTFAARRGDWSGTRRRAGRRHGSGHTTRSAGVTSPAGGFSAIWSMYPSL